MQDGFDILIGNPPYSAIGERSDFHLLKARFEIAERGAGRNEAEPISFVCGDDVAVYKTLLQCGSAGHSSFLGVS